MIDCDFIEIQPSLDVDTYNITVYDTTLEGRYGPMAELGPKHLHSFFEVWGDFDLNKAMDRIDQIRFLDGCTIWIYAKPGARFLVGATDPDMPKRVEIT
jgi:hypothetical protein